MNLYLDVETLPLGTLAHIAASLTLDDPPAGWTAPPYPDGPVFDWKPGGNLKKAETIEEHRQIAVAKHLEAQRAHEAGRLEWPRTAARAEWESRRAWSLLPSRAEIACLGYAVDDGPVVVVDGGQALEALGALFSDGKPDATVRRPKVDKVIAWNATFDAAHLFNQALRVDHWITPFVAAYPYAVRAEHKLWSGPQWIDAATLYPTVRGDGEGKQETAARVMGVGQPHPLRGSEVFDAVVGGRMADVMAHCAADVGELRAIYRRLWAVAEVLRG